MLSFWIIVTGQILVSFERNDAINIGCQWNLGDVSLLLAVHDSSENLSSSDEGINNIA